MVVGKALADPGSDYAFALLRLCVWRSGSDKSFWYDESSVITINFGSMRQVQGQFVTYQFLASFSIAYSSQ
jgi:hypothetical protein